MMDSWVGFTPRMVATDVDGTIVPLNGTISEQTRRAFRACIEFGIEVVLVTGRPPRWMQPVADAAGFRASAICANGAITVDTENFDILDISTIPGSSLTEMVALLQRAIPDAAFAAESPTMLRAGPGYEDAQSGVPPKEGLIPIDRFETILRTSSVREMVEADIYKLVVTSDRLAPDELLKVTREEVSHLGAVTRSVSGRALVEVGPLGMTKAKTLASYAAARGIDSSEVIAFGDMPNDAEMLRWAGRSYAMAGSHSEATAAAQFLAPSAADNGVAVTLERMLEYSAEL